MLFKWKFSNSSATNDTELMNKNIEDIYPQFVVAYYDYVLQCPGFANGFLFEIISLSVVRRDAIYVEIFNTMR